jgi:hypothetical protein
MCACMCVKSYKTLNYEYEEYIKRMTETKIRILYIIYKYFIRETSR